MAERDEIKINELLESLNIDNEKMQELIDKPKAGEQEYNYDDFDNELANLENEKDYETIEIKLPTAHAEKVKEWLKSNAKTSSESTVMSPPYRYGLGLTRIAVNANIISGA